MTLTPDRHGHLRRPLGLLEFGVSGLWLCLWDVIVERGVWWHARAVVLPRLIQILPYLVCQLKLSSGHLCNKCWSHFDNACHFGKMA